uniref:Uncharacterized protein n=1 Tax=Unknown prokaryotic organism TaxID=2725 RepID=A0A0F7YYS2_UNKP|nr:hypothetical protein [unidentified prokaryotic organism]
MPLPFYGGSAYLTVFGFGLPHDNHLSVPIKVGLRLFKPHD